MNPLMLTLHNTLRDLKKELRILRKQKIEHSDNLPLDLLDKIEDHHTAIRLTKQSINGYLSYATWQADLALLEISIKINPTDNIYAHITPEPIEQSQLKAANKQLASLPLDHIPPITKLPPHSYVPFQANAIFTGRDNELRDIARVLKAGQPVAISQAVASPPKKGMGKRQLALQIAHRYGQYFAGGVFWLNFKHPNIIDTQVALCGQHSLLAHRPGFATLPQTEQVRLVLSAWQTKLPRLLIFYNCESEALLNNWQPIFGECRILIISNRETWPSSLNIHTISLDGLAREKSINLLQTLHPPLSQKHAHDMAETLDDLPLALCLAGNLLQHSQPHISPSTYLNNLKESDNTPFFTEYPSPVAQAFSLSYNYLNTTDPTYSNALVLLSQATYFAADYPLPYKLLLSAISIQKELEKALVDKTEEDLDDVKIDDEVLEEEALAAQAVVYKDALQCLINLGLLHYEDNDTLILDGYLSLLVKQAIPATLSGQVAVEFTLLEICNRLFNEDRVLDLKPLQAHLIAVAETIVAKHNERGTNYVTVFAHFLHGIDAHQAAKQLYEQALKMRQEILGNNHLDTADSFNNLGKVMEAMGNYQAAKPLYEQALAIQQTLLDNDDVKIAIGFGNLGKLHQTLGDYKTAKSFYEQTLAIYQKLYGNNHLDTATCLGNLASILEAMGDYKAAKALYEQVLATQQTLLGTEHVKTAITINALGLLNQALGEYKAAKPFFEQAVAINKKLLGLEHTTTATCLSNLGTLLTTLGDYETAESLFNQALDIHKKTIGNENDSVAATLNSLAQLLIDVKKDYKAAEPLLKQVVSIHQKIYGHKHPKTAICLNNLAFIYLLMDDHETAYPLYEQALAINKKVFGDEHHTTANTLNNIAYFHQTQEEYEMAKTLFEQVLAIRQKTLGDEHPTTASSLSGLGYLYRLMKDYEQAKPFYEQALSIYKKVYGNNHFIVANTLTSIGFLHQVMEDYKGAKPFYKQVLAIHIKLYGHKHPTTAKTLSDLGFLHERMNNYTKAKTYYTKALAIFEEHLPPDDPTIINLQNVLFELEEKKKGIGNLLKNLFGK